MKKVLISVLSFCFVFVLNLICEVNVKADVPPAPPVGNQIVYYFSDNYDSPSFIDEIMTNTSLDSDNIEYCYWGERFYENFENYYNEFGNIEEAFVIFELTYGIENILYYNNLYFTDELEDVFATLKNNGCYIMFICATDELIYQSHNDFLDYVDFHIITSSYFHSIINIFYHLEQNYGNPPSDASLIFNYQFLISCGGYYNFKRFYLIPYINSRYYDDLRSMSQAEALASYGLDIYVADDMNYSYIKINSDYHGYLDLRFESIAGEVNCYGATNDMYEASLDWLEYISDIYPSYVYHYNMHNYYFDYENIFGPFVQVNSITAIQSIYDELLPMVVDFLTNTLEYCKASYDNWKGRCEITHMMLGTNSDGWIQCLYGTDGDFYNCWDMYNRGDILDFDDGSLF